MIFALHPNIERFGTRFRLKDFVAVCGQKVANQFSLRRLIFDDQYGFGAAAGCVLRRLWLGWFGRLYRAGEIHTETGAFPQFAFDFHPPLMLLDDAINSRQPKTGPLPHLLGGKEWLENSAEILWRNAATSVNGTQADKPAQMCFVMLSNVAGIYFHDGNLNCQLSALGHGVAGIHRQIQEDLLHHAGVSMNRSGLREIADLQ